MYKRLKSKLLAAALTLALIPSAFTCTALAAEVTDPPLVKAAGYQDFPAYYEDSHHLSDQVTHPDVVIMDEEWNGYRYWAIYTPNVMRISIYENPSIVASNDGVHWEVPNGLTNPIDPQPSSTRYHNCDADMIYNPEMDAMMGYWNWADDQAGGVGAEVRLRISYDGVHWGVPVTYDAETRTWTKPTTEEERQVVSGPTDFIPAVTSSARYDMLSPTFVYDSFRDVFIDVSGFWHPTQHRDRNTAKGREAGLPRTRDPLLSGEEFRRPRSQRQENCQYKNHECLAGTAK